MQYVIPPIKKIFDPNQIPHQKNMEDNFHKVQTRKCTKTLYQTDTIRPVLQCEHSNVLYYTDGTVIFCIAV